MPRVRPTGNQSETPSAWLCSEARRLTDWAKGPHLFHMFSNLPFLCLTSQLSFSMPVITFYFIITSHSSSLVSHLPRHTFHLSQYNVPFLTFCTEYLAICSSHFIPRCYFIYLTLLFSHLNLTSKFSNFEYRHFFWLTFSIFAMCMTSHCSRLILISYFATITLIAFHISIPKFSHFIILFQQSVPKYTLMPQYSHVL